MFLVVRADLWAILRTLESGGWRLLWLIPYRALFYTLYALCWLTLLRPVDPAGCATFGYVYWVTLVRDAVDRLLPVASVGGSVVGVRLLRWRGLAAPPLAASVIVEIVLTLLMVYLFIALGLILMVDFSGPGHAYRRVAVGFLLSLPLPAVALWLLRYGSLPQRLHQFLGPVLGKSVPFEQAAALDFELRAALHRMWPFTIAGALQFGALVSGSFEVWFALRLFGHPVSVPAALVLESMVQAVRHAAFAVPGGIGVQEAGLVLFGQAFGVDAQSALAVSMAKRMREIACGVPALISWQWAEGSRLHRQMRFREQSR